MDAKEKALGNSAENLVSAPDYTEDFSKEWINLHALNLMTTVETLSKARAVVGTIPPVLMFIKDERCLECKVMEAENKNQAETEMIAYGKYAKEKDSEVVISVFESFSRKVKETDTIKSPADIPIEEQVEAYPESMNTLAFMIYLFDCVNKKAAIFKQDIIELDTGFALGKVERFPVKNVSGNLVDNFFKGYDS
jgi:hypothetical protein